VLRGRLCAQETLAPFLVFDDRRQLSGLMHAAAAARAATPPAPAPE